jgi:hypothetical protein
MADEIDTTLCDKVCQSLATGLWLSLGTLVSSTNKSDCHDITEILFKVAFNTINQPTNLTLRLYDLECNTGSHRLLATVS